MQCQGVTKKNTQCKNKVIDGNYCWLHLDQEQKMDSNKQKINYNLDQETEFLMYSYLPLEEVLTIFRNDIIKRDEIIKRYFKKLPHLNMASKNGELETVKYLVNLGEIPEKYDLDMASFSKNLELFKYLITLDIKPDKGTLDWASLGGNLKIVKYLVNSGIEPDKNTLEDAKVNGNLDVVGYLIKKLK